MRSRRRPLEWECANLPAPIRLPAANCDQSVIVNTGAYDEEYSDGTLVRVRGELEVYPAPLSPVPATTVRRYAYGAAGIMELSGQASEDPATLIDCPYTDCDSEWLWHTYWSAAIEIVQPGGAGSSVAMIWDPFTIEIDSSAKRKLESGASSLWFAIETGVGSLEVDYWWGVRVLLAEK